VACVCFLTHNGEKDSEVVTDYEKRLQEMSFVPRLSCARAMLWEGGGPNKIFIAYLLCYQNIAVHVGRGLASV